MQHSLYNFMIEMFETHPEFHIANESDFEKIQILLAESSMEISGLAELSFSRPDLLGSFIEQGQKPLLIVDEEVNFLAVFSEMSFVVEGVEKDVYYLSDLRIGVNTSRKVKVLFRKLYKEVLNTIDRTFYSTVLEDNKKAILSLASGRAGIFYNELFKLETKTFVLTPGLAKRSKRYEFLSINEEEFNNEYNKVPVGFSHKMYFQNDKLFKILKNGVCVGVISLYRPSKKTLSASPLCKTVDLCLKMIKFFSKKSLEKCISWTFVTSFTVSEEIDQTDVFKQFISFLKREKIVNSFEILSMTVKEGEELPNCKMPSFLTKSVFYEVSKEELNHSVETRISINPLYL